MGFLNKLFGNSNERIAEEPGNQRAQFKNVKHFETMLKKKDEDIRMFLEINEELSREGRIEPFHYWSIAVVKLDKVYIAYSIGEPVEKCYELFLEATEWYVKGWDPEAAYSDLIDMVSLAYLLQIPDDKFAGIVNYVQHADESSDEPAWQPDGILWYIINARKPGGVQPDKVIWPELYQDLLNLIRMPKAQAEAAMKDYLEKWYKLHRNDPWYETHKKELVYKGYWCWEAGAITKIMQLDDSSFKDNLYYPYDMVHWSNPTK